MAALSYTTSIEATDLFRISRTLASLSDDDQAWLARARASLGLNLSLEEEVRRGVAMNQNFITQMTMPGKCGMNELTAFGPHLRAIPQLVARDWSCESEERNALINPILVALQKKVSPTTRILIPGSGLGRLMYQVAELGYSCFGTEADALSRSVMEYMFKLGLEGDSVPLQPYVLETCNRLHHSDHIRTLRVPDTQLHVDVLARIRMVTSEIFETEKKFGAIITSPDSVTPYSVSRCRSVLLPGGAWINCGLLDEDPRPLLEGGGFQVEEFRELVAPYLCNGPSMMQTRRACVFFVARRV